MLEPTPTVTASVCLLRPRARGALTLRSPSIVDAPRMQANYLGDPKDVATMIAGVRLAVKVMATPLLSDFRAAIPLPQDDAALLAMLRDLVGAVMHPVGTCRMGQHADAVVDAELRVHGIAGLRVADASVMPAIVSANTNAASMMIGEKAGDLLRRR